MSSASSSCGLLREGGEATLCVHDPAHEHVHGRTKGAELGSLAEDLVEYEEHLLGRRSTHKFSYLVKHTNDIRVDHSVGLDKVLELFDGLKKFRSSADGVIERAGARHPFGGTSDFSL
ncbi:phosphatidylserine decarboxylase [Moniliophthora roreri]|nr:phosphatidylserine decarboxylase [Moniliophthora roreri]